ncbi:acyl-CoA dehydrogenase family protein [Primorskyibacter sp. 2E107]|uniref:acyl-CoA dehydrogenase family protein n=1 Tax=Primorskyibacter sp. 2E107 TaxID=3403458 RepID=UPI003AF944D2
MDFGYTQAQEALIARGKRDAMLFAAEGTAFGKSQAWQRVAQAGWAGLCVTGGGGHNALETVAGFEALGRGGAARGALFALGAHLFGAAKAIENFAQPEVRDEWLTRMGDGACVGALALTEPTGGSALGCDGTVLTDDGSDGFTLTGTKTFVTNATSAGVAIVLAREADVPAPMNLTVVAVPTDAKGIRAVPLDGYGLRGSDMGTLHFDGCRIGEGQILGKRRAGLGVVLSMMQWERTCILAGALGALDRDIAQVRKALSERKDGRGSLLGHQAIAHGLVDLWQQVETARLVLYRAAWSLDQGKDALRQSALCKLTLSRTLVNGSVELQRLMAGAGWANALGLADGVQDALAMAAASGTDEIQRNLIASRLGSP